MFNDLDLYGPGINNPANGITLRTDIHECFDRHGVALYPAEQGFKIHVIKKFSDYAELLHLRTLVMPARVPIEFLYARFAFTIINLIPESSFNWLGSVKVPNGIEEAKKTRLIKEAESRKKNKLTSIPENNGPGVEIGMCVL